MTQAPVLSTGDVGHASPVLPYASVGRRAAAVIIDGVVLMAGGWLIAFVAGETNGVSFSIYGAKVVLLFALFGVYCVALETWIGATLGKLVVGVRVVDENGQRIDLASSTIRNVLRIVDSQIGYLVGAIVAWRSPTLQRVGDRAAGTFVVLTPARARRLVQAAEIEGGLFNAVSDRGITVQEVAADTTASKPLRRKRLIAALLAAGSVAFGALVAILAPSQEPMTGSDGNTISARAVERVLRTKFADKGLPLSDLNCPGDRKAVQGDQFECTARLEGKLLRLQVEQTNGRGGVTARGLQSVLPVRKIEEAITTAILRETGNAVTVNCGDGQFRVEEPGARFDCSAVYPSVGTRPVSVTVKDANGNVTFHFPR